MWKCIDFFANLMINIIPIIFFVSIYLVRLQFLCIHSRPHLLWLQYFCNFVVIFCLQTSQFLFWTQRNLCPQFIKKKFVFSAELVSEPGSPNSKTSTLPLSYSTDDREWTFEKQYKVSECCEEVQHVKTF